MVDYKVIISGTIVNHSHWDGKTKPAFVAGFFTVSKYCMKIRPADTRGFIPTSRLGNDDYQSYRSFSCMNYYDPKYTNWGPVITINDDRTKPGFITAWHEHQGLDIINYMVKGQCRHIDDKGNDNTATVGQVQHFWCGPSIYHSLSNESTEDSRYLQIWIMPASPTNSPTTYQIFDRDHGFAKLPIEFKNTFIEVWAGELDYSVDVTTNSYLLVLEGSCKVNDIELKEGDALDIDSFATITPNGVAHIILFEINYARR
jgi:redox-sensitive bicupin YhaK (pirin superfamily)